MILAGFLAAQSGGTSLLTNPAAWLSTWAAGTRTLSGETVSPDSAMALSAYFGCIRNISEDCAKLPFVVIRRDGRERIPIPDHPIRQLLGRTPNRLMGAMTFRELLTSWVLGWGNGYAEIIRTPRGVPIELLPLHPSRVEPKNDDGEIVYEVRREPGEPADILSADSVFHLRGLGTALKGDTVARYGAEAMGRALAVQKYTAAYFGNGARPGGLLKHPGSPSPEARRNIRESFMTAHQGAENMFLPLLLEEGIEWNPLSPPPEEAQMIETMEFTVVDVARWFRMPPHKIQHLANATFTNIGSQKIEYVDDTLMAWLIRWEQEADRKLLASDEYDLESKHRVTGLLRGDHKERSEFYRTMFNIGAMSQNDIRELEDQNPIEGGDAYYVPLAMRDSSMPAEPEAAPPAAQTPRLAPADDQAAFIGAVKRAHVWLIADAFARFARRSTPRIKAAVTRHGPGETLDAWVIAYCANAEPLKNDILPPLSAMADVLGAALGIAGHPGIQAILDAQIAEKASDYLSALQSRINTADELTTAVEGPEFWSGPEQAVVLTDWLAESVLSIKDKHDGT